MTRPLLALAAFEQELKWLALALGLASTIAIVQDWQPWPMILGLPFCLIWIYCGWLHTERQLKWINILFSALYVYGLLRWALGT
ncbi:peptidase [Salipiger sp. IMCC34102]|uniref:peptidase n=1 Tax=Salipiger sp. IMCC34102 TaxID=2510647 RepID=UPI00101B9F59|nr:peptidase [Salipiger sp. IMCC34102]RYH02361.1 peptidase [Salipiger sp. IMCC34102]